MKKALTTLLAAVLALGACLASERTLRLDYIFSGTDKTAEIALDAMGSYGLWAGRSANLDRPPLRGNGQITMYDALDGSILYCNSFSTLFQEWQATEEATRVRRSFENVFLLPMPERRARVKVELYGFRGEVSASFEHEVDPEDILIRSYGKNDAPCRYIRQSGSPQECIDVAIVAEGYRADEAELFYRDAQAAVDAILEHEPFASMSGKFNFLAVALASKDSGVSIPVRGEWKDTALGAHFSTFYSDRYLTTLQLKKLHDSLAGLPYEHIIILANTDNYGGGGIFNSYTLTTAHHQNFRPVVVHEFGHSFAGLADEYFYDDQYVEMYYPEAEPWEQNITTLKDFGSKWKGLLPKGCRIPTSPIENDKLWEKIAGGAPAGKFVGVYEGGGYQSKGVFRPYPDCRMRTNAAPVFCPVCQDAIRRLIEFNLGED